MPELYIIGGCNGSGKTTISKQILPYFLNIYEYFNADKIAYNLSPFRQESVAIKAEKLMRKMLNYLCQNQVNFAFETTLSGLNYIRFLQQYQNKSYQINLIYLWLNNPQLAIARVKQRVASGGHNIPEDVIIHRYYRGQKKLIESYIPLCDTWVIFNNTNFPSQLIAEKRINQTPIIYQPKTSSKIMEIKL